jgi:hypothetical protein
MCMCWQTPPMRHHQGQHNGQTYHRDAEKCPPKCHRLAPSSSRSPPRPISYTPTFTMPFGNNVPWFLTAPSCSGIGPHASGYQRTNNIPPPNQGTAMMVNMMAFKNNYPFPCNMLTVAYTPAYNFPGVGIGCWKTLKSEVELSAIS